MTIIAKKSSQHESQTESCETRLYSAISEYSSVKGTPTHIRDWLTSSLPDSLASHSVSPESERALTTTEICGLTPSMSFAEYDHGSHSWKTYQVSLFTNTPDEFTAIWPKAGMTVGGVAYLQPKWERRIAEIGGGAWPSPDTQNHRDGSQMRKAAHGRHAVSLHHAVHLFPTPTDASKGGGSSRSGDRINEIPTLQGMARKGLWPTPTVGDSRSSGSRNTENSKAHAGISLTDAIRGDGGKGRMFPTPYVLSANQGQGDGEFGKAIRQWPTPNASDNRDRGNLTSGAVRRRREKGKQIMLSQSVSDVSGALNPTWVEWLMNWPIGWTSLEPIDHAEFEYWKAASTAEIRSDNLPRMWFNIEAGAPSQGRESREQRTNECDYSMFELPSSEALESEASELRNLPKEVSAEAQSAEQTMRRFELQQRARQTISRVAVGIVNRVDRLRALGNGQVPAVVRAAWDLLVR